MRHDNYAGCAKIAAEVKTPIQIGENLLNTFEFQKAIDAKAAEFYMPDVQRIGGVTGWLRAAALAHAHNLDMSSHLFPEFSSHLLAVDADLPFPGIRGLGRAGSCSSRSRSRTDTWPFPTFRGRHHLERGRGQKVFAGVN